MTDQLGNLRELGDVRDTGDWAGKRLVTRTQPSASAVAGQAEGATAGTSVTLMAELCSDSA